MNDYSAVKEDQAEYKSPAQDGEGKSRCDALSKWLPYSTFGSDLASRLLRVTPVTGRCYVITFNKFHNRTLADLSVEQIQPVIDTWTKLYGAHLDPYSPLAALAPTSDLNIKPPPFQLRYMQIFENKGAAMGCSNPHPHGQVWTTTGMPEEPGLELEQLIKYRKEHGGAHLLEDYAKLEMEKQERIVFENDTFLALCPWWAIWPFETMIVSKKHKRALVDFNKEEQTHLAQAISEVTRRYDNLFETHFPYSELLPESHLACQLLVTKNIVGMGLHQAPLTGTGEEIEASHFHIHFYPPLLRSATVRKFLVGYEMMAEPQRDITPEQATARLRNCGGELYRAKLATQESRAAEELGRG